MLYPTVPAIVVVRPVYVVKIKVEPRERTLYSLYTYTRFSPLVTGTLKLIKMQSVYVTHPQTTIFGCKSCQKIDINYDLI